MYIYIYIYSTCVCMIYAMGHRGHKACKRVATNDNSACTCC